MLRRTGERLAAIWWHSGPRPPLFASPWRVLGADSQPSESEVGLPAAEAAKARDELFAADDLLGEILEA